MDLHSPLGSLSLASALQGAWRAHLMGLVPLTCPPGAPRPPFHDLALARVEGMRPWLRLALDEETAVALERSGRARFHVGALMGEHDERVCPALLQAEPAEISSIRLVELLCEEGSGVHVHSTVRTAQMRDLHRDLPGHSRTPFLDELIALDRREYEECRGYCVEPMASYFEVLMRTMAASCGTELPTDAGESPWSERTTGAVIVSRKPARFAIGGGVLYEESMLLRADDGSEWTVHDSRGASNYPRYEPVGERLVLTLRGCTSGHKGYVQYVETERNVRTRAEVAEWLRRHDETQAILARHREEERIGCISRDGVRLEEGARVILDCDCLEARQGAQGEVVEILGTMAMVKFEGRRQRVPCVGGALLAA